jgi:hypothetical protein
MVRRHRDRSDGSRSCRSRAADGACLSTIGVHEGSGSRIASRGSTRGTGASFFESGDGRTRVRGAVADVTVFSWKRVAGTAAKSGSVGAPAKAAASHAGGDRRTAPLCRCHSEIVSPGSGKRELRRRHDRGGPSCDPHDRFRQSRPRSICQPGSSRHRAAARRPARARSGRAFLRRCGADPNGGGGCDCRADRKG